MSLSEEATERLSDIVELQPTKNSELQDRWEMDSGSEVHQYLESELGDYYYRDEDSLIRATPDAAELVGADPDSEEARVVQASELQRQVVEVAPGPDDRSESVVSVLHALRDAFEIDPPADDVRSALKALDRKGIVETVNRTVPTYRLALPRDEIEIAVPE